MYIFKRIDETLIKWISDSSSDTQSSPSLSLIHSPLVDKNTTLIDIMNDRKYIEIKEEIQFVCSDKGEICHSDSEIYYNNKSDSDVQPDFQIKENNVIYLENNEKTCCCIIL